MTKQIIILFFFIGLFVNCQNNLMVVKIEDGNYYYQLKGPVKELEINTFDYLKNNQGVTKGRLNNIKKLGGGGGKYFFDKSGSLSAQISFRPGTNEPRYYFEYKFKDEKLIRRVDYDSSKRKKRIGKIEYAFNDKGDLISRIHFDASFCDGKEWMITSKDVFRYNYEKNTIKQIDSSFSNYDCDDIEIKVTTYNHFAKFEDNKKLEDDYRFYTYGKDGNLTLVKYKNEPTFNEFHPNGIRKKQFINDQNYHEFDKDGYLTKSVVAARTGDVYICEYTERDSYGNWTEMITYEDGKPYLITERRITYY